MTEDSALTAGLDNANAVDQRRNDWRCGAIVYHVLVDRFVPSNNLDEKRHLYPAPKKIRKWTEEPRRGRFLSDHAVWAHEVDFWGGDLKSLMTRLDYIEEMGADCLYLNPIHESFTNHKYGAIDYRAISPEYGTRNDVRDLANQLHDRKMRLMIDGVFNHVGIRSHWFQEAKSDPKSRKRDWFDFKDAYEHGFRAWQNVPNLAELNLENESLREEMWLSDDSVVASYLNDGVDGWRLDVAYDIGPYYLRELTESAHRVRPDSCVIGEVWTYPSGWANTMDGLMNFNFRQLAHHLVDGKISGPQAGRILQEQVDDTGIDGMLKSWLILDNHDTYRLRTTIPRRKNRRFAQALQMTLPGSPCIYYGVELGMRGGDDPEMRGPMPWHEFNDSNAELQSLKQLIEIRKRYPALRFGAMKTLTSDRLLAFARFTDKTQETVIVVANPTDQVVNDVLSPGIPWLLNRTPVKDQLSKFATQLDSGLMEVQVPSRTVMILKPQSKAHHGYDPHKRLP